MKDSREEIDKLNTLDYLRTILARTLHFEGISVTMSIAKAIDAFINHDVDAKIKEYALQMLGEDETDIGGEEYGVIDDYATISRNELRKEIRDRIQKGTEL